VAPTPGARPLGGRELPEGPPREISGGEPVTEPPGLAELLDRWRTDQPGDQAFCAATSTGWASLTWAELADAAAGVARRAPQPLLRSAPVVVVVDNSAESVAVLLGLWLANYDTLLVESGSSHLADGTSAVRQAGPGGIVAPVGTVAELRTSWSADPAADSLVTHADLLGQPGTATALAAAPTLGDPAVLQMTSGSTGEPRIAVQRLSSLLRGGAIYVARHRIRRSDQILAPIPLTHSFGIVGGLMTTLCCGSGLATMPRLMLRPLHERLSRPGTVLLGTPLLYRVATAAAAGFAPISGNVRAPLCSGGPLADDAAAAARSWLGAEVLQVYGSTETGLISCQYDRGRPWAQGSVGTLAAGVTARLAAGADSTLTVRTSTMFDGYLGGPAVTGFYETGDVADADDQGELYIRGRKATFVNVGGRKVNVARTERIIRESGLVRDTAVYGVDSGTGEEELHAAIELRAGVTIADVSSHCRANLAPYEVPHAFHVVGQLPRGPLGKVERSRLPR
jgi:acyl-CoA synthetase (AMP-forming)/AMP-acid ligase II